MFERTYTDIQPTSLNGLLRAMDSAIRSVKRDSGAMPDEIMAGSTCRDHYEMTLWAIQPDPHARRTHHPILHLVFMGLPVRHDVSVLAKGMEFRKNGKVVARVTYLGVD